MGKFQNVPSQAIQRATGAFSPAVSATLTPAGGVVTYGDGSISFPPGAVAASIAISVHRHPKVHGVFIEPSLTLLRPAVIRHSIGEIVVPAGHSLIAAHVHSQGDVHPSSGEITASELIPVTNDKGAAVFEASRFSGYLVATGINEGQPCDPGDGDPNCVWVDDG